jgi:hypothetical protein
MCVRIIILPTRVYVFFSSFLHALNGLSAEPYGFTLLSRVRVIINNM